jgi:hypothetical protein
MTPALILAKVIDFIMGTALKYIAVAALTFAVVQTVRIEGFWFIDGLQDKVTKCDAATAVATAKASEGAVAASSAAADTVAGVEAGNQRMREAAAKSDDPLRDAFKALGK